MLSARSSGRSGLLIVPALALAALAGGAVGCAGGAGQGALREPWAYCRAAGTVDAPAARALGPEDAAALHARVREAFALPADMPDETVAAWTVWRCADGEVWGCIVGANLPCQEPADTSRTPGEALREYCRDRPDEEAIPMAATGRATIYSWRCRDGEPVVEAQWSEPDARGFHRDLWRRLAPP